MDRTPLRVAVLTRSVYPLHGFGGLERHVSDLIRHLLARGVIVTLIAPPPRADSPEPGTGQEVLAALRHEHLIVRSVPYRTFPFAGRRGTTVLDRSTAYPVFGLRAGRLAAGLARAHEVDIVHGMGASAYGYARAQRASRTDNVPLVLNPHGLEEFGGTDQKRARLKRVAYRPLQAAVRACAASANRVIATDRSLVPVIQKHLRVPVSRIGVVPNAVDLAVADALAGPHDGRSMRQQHGIGDDAPVLLSAGRIERNKGYDVLARAVAMLAATPGTASAVRWVLVGNGSARPALERLVDALQIRDRVLLPGRLPDPKLHAWFEAATLFVHPTLYEGSSIVTLEAMAHRRAIVASNAGGLPDKVRPNGNGWLVAPGSVEALGHGLLEALSHPDRLPAMGAESRRIVEREFSWPTVTTRLLDLYDDVLSEQARSR